MIQDIARDRVFVAKDKGSGEAGEGLAREKKQSERDGSGEGLDEEDDRLCGHGTVEASDSDTSEEEKLNLMTDGRDGVEQSPDQACNKEAVVESLVFKQCLNQDAIAEFFGDTEDVDSAAPEKHL